MSTLSLRALFAAGEGAVSPPQVEPLMLSPLYLLDSDIANRKKRPLKAPTRRPYPYHITSTYPNRPKEGYFRRNPQPTNHHNRRRTQNRPRVAPCTPLRTRPAEAAPSPRPARLADAPTAELADFL